MAMFLEISPYIINLEEVQYIQVGSDDGTGMHRVSFTFQDSPTITVKANKDAVDRIREAI
jgi:hypothetical protein